MKGSQLLRSVSELLSKFQQQWHCKGIPVPSRDLLSTELHPASTAESFNLWRRSF